MLKTRRSTLHFKAATHARAKGAVAVTKRAALLGGRNPRYRIGIWDIDAYAGFLFRVLDELNNAQSLFRFVRIEATVPMGLTLSGDRTRQIVKDFGGNPKTRDIALNVFAPDVLNASKPMRKNLKIDVLACVVSPMIMDYVDENCTRLGWNYFSSARKRTIVVSAYELRTYAVKAGRPFEAALAAVVLGSVLCSVFSRIRFHDETRGCLLDYCERRDDIVMMLRNLEICAESLDQIPKYARPDVLRILTILKKYRR